MRVAIFASGNGSNFEVLAQKFQQGQMAGELVLLFCDHPDAYVVKKGWEVPSSSRNIYG